MKPLSISEGSRVRYSAIDRGAQVVLDRGVVVLPHLQVVGISAEGGADPH